MKTILRPQRRWSRWTCRRRAGPRLATACRRCRNRTPRSHHSPTTPHTSTHMKVGGRRQVILPNELAAGASWQVCSLCWVRCACSAAMAVAAAAFTAARCSAAHMSPSPVPQPPTLGLAAAPATSSDHLAGTSRRAMRSAPCSRPLPRAPPSRTRSAHLPRRQRRRRHRGERSLPCQCGESISCTRIQSPSCVAMRRSRAVISCNR